MCGSTRAHFWLRALRPGDTESFTRRHENVDMPSSDSRRAECPNCCAHPFHFALSASGTSLRLRGRPAAHLASWADSLRMVRQLHPTIAERMVAGLGANDLLAWFRSVRQCQQAVLDAGFEDAPWQDSAPLREEEPEPTQPKARWQRATTKLEENFVRPNT